MNNSEKIVIEIKEDKKRNWFSLKLVMYFIAIIAILLLTSCDCKMELQKTKELMTLKDNVLIHGSAFLFMGSFEDDTYFHYYQKNGEYYELKKVRTYEAKVKFTSGTPKVKYYLRGPCRPLIIFEVPKGSIVNQYKLDAE